MAELPLPPSVEIFDTTLRDGAQFEGISLTVDDKLKVAEQLDWLVPGMLKEKIEALLRSLPLRYRRLCVPIPDYTEGVYQRWFEQALDPQQNLIAALCEDIRRQKGEQVQAEDFKPEDLPAHLRMNIHVVDDKGRFLAGGRDLQPLQQKFSKQAQQKFQAAASKDNVIEALFGQTKITDWSCGQWQSEIELDKGKQQVLAYPALKDVGSACEIVLLDEPAEARKIHKQGLKRLFLLQLREAERYQKRELQKTLLPQALQLRSLGDRKSVV